MTPHCRRAELWLFLAPLPFLAVYIYNITAYHYGFRHRESITALAYSPDGKTVATGCFDGKLYLWDVETARLKQTFSMPTKRVEAIAFSPDGQKVAALSSYNYQQVVHVWQVGTGEQSWSARFGGGGFVRILFSPDGRYLAIHKPIIEMRDATTGTLLWHKDGEAYEGRQMIFSADSRTLIHSDDSSRFLVLWDSQTGATRRRLKIPGRFHIVGLSYRDHKLAVLRFDTVRRRGREVVAVKLAEVESGNSLSTLDIIDSENYNLSATSPDCRLLCLQDNQGILHFWDLTSGKLVKQVKASSEALVLYAFSPDNKSLVYAEKNELKVVAIE